MRNLCHSRSEAHAFHTCAAHFSVFLICLSSRSPIQPPPLRGTSFHRKGLAERSEARLASFWGGEAPSSLPTPLGKWDRAAVLGCSYTACLRRSPTLFHIASTLSAPSWHLPHAGKALSVVILFPHMRVFALTMREKRHSRIVVAFPLGEGGPRSGG